MPGDASAPLPNSASVELVDEMVNHLKGMVKKTVRKVCNDEYAGRGGLRTRDWIGSTTGDPFYSIKNSRAAGPSWPNAKYTDDNRHQGPLCRRRAEDAAGPHRAGEQPSAVCRPRAEPGTSVPKEKRMVMTFQMTRTPTMTCMEHLRAPVVDGVRRQGFRKVLQIFVQCIVPEIKLVHFFPQVSQPSAVGCP